jgi:hypothetical protein
MRRRFHDQLMLDLTPGDRRVLPGTAPEELLPALADLLLEALSDWVGQPIRSRQGNNGIEAEREPGDASQDHV